MICRVHCRFLAFYLGLAACGTSAEALKSADPPRPPALFAPVGGTTDEVRGTVSDLHPATRSMVLSAEGSRYVAILGQQGIIEVDGSVISFADLPTGREAVASGVLDGDILVLRRLSIGAARPDGVPAGIPTGEAPAEPASSDPVGTSATPPGAAPGSETTPEVALPTEATPP